MTETVVKFESVTRRFGAVQAVDGLDLTIGRGQTVALLGANGAGKSTTISLLLGLLAPHAGQVHVLGETPERAVAAGRVGAMLQEGGLMPGVTVRGLVELACRIYPGSRTPASVLAEAGLCGITGRRVDRLSGGQTQRLRFALAIAGNPELLVLDEPTAAMDVASRRTFWDNIRAYAAGGRTVLFATHYLEEADSIADRIVVIAAGRVVRDGTPTEIKAAAGGRTVRFTLGEDTGAGLDRLPGVTAVEIHDQMAALRTDDAEATVRALFAGRDRVRDIEVTGAELEDAVLALTN
jgi:ABC-2 type transport system ATP-binding protein